MRLEEQVISLELAKELKELNCRQESLWWWNTHYDDGHHLHRFGEMIDDLMVISGDKRNSMLENYSIKDYTTYREYSAFTVAELGEMLPRVILGSYHSLRIAKNDHPINLWHISYEGCREIRVSLSANTEANARAKMVLYLVKEGLLKF